MSGRCDDTQSSTDSRASFVAELHFLASKHFQRARNKNEVGDTPAANKISHVFVAEEALSASLSTSTNRFKGKALQVASGLDGRVSSEYELLEGASSEGSAEVEDLILEEDEKESIGWDGQDESSCTKNERKDKGNNYQFDKTATNILPRSSKTKTPRVLHLPVKSDLKTQGIRIDREGKYVNASPDANVSPNIDHWSLTLHELWKRITIFTHLIQVGTRQTVSKVISRSAYLNALTGPSINTSILEAAASITSLTKGFTYVAKCKQALSRNSIVRVHNVIIPTLIATIFLVMCNHAYQLQLRNAQLETGITSLRIALQSQPKTTKLDGDVVVGVPPAFFREHQIVKLHFHGFSTFDSNKGQIIKSSTFNCFNHEWLVEMYPGGSDKAQDGMASIYLRHLSDNPVAIYFEFDLDESDLAHFNDAKLGKDARDNGPQVAAYSSMMDVPRCHIDGSECSSADLLKGRGNSGRGSESRTNTLDSCADGNAGSYLRDESVERITVKSSTESDIREGDTIIIEADIFCHSKRSLAGIFHATNPSNPVWNHVGTFSCTTDGHKKITTQYTLTEGEPEQAIRVSTRQDKSKASCSGGKYDDTDDLVFRVKRKGKALSHKFDRDSSSLRGYHDFIKSPFLSNFSNLNLGTLSIDLRMQLIENKSHANLIPENPFEQDMLKLFLDEPSADVLFELSDDNSSKVHYHAHRLILRACAPALALLCEGYDKSHPVTIPDLEPRVFLQLLRYVYGGDITPDWTKDAKKILDAADKYGLTNLKLTAEAWYVTYYSFTVGNVVEELLYADAKNCPLLREAAIGFILKNAKEVMKSASFESILKTKSTTKEIMLAMASTEHGGKPSDNENDPIMSINDLRIALYQKNLKISGSRKSLVDRLEKYQEE